MTIPRPRNQNVDWVEKTIKIELKHVDPSLSDAEIIKSVQLWLKHSSVITVNDKTNITILNKEQLEALRFV